MGKRRGQSYSQDLRDRVLAATEEAIRSVAARLHVSPSYVSKARSKFRLTGDATPGPQRNHVRPKLEPLYGALRARVAEQADAIIAELRAWVAREHGVSVSHAAMWETLARLGLTLKKSGCAPPSRSVRTSPRRARPGPSCSPSGTRAG